MLNANYIEWIGYLASLLIVVSLTMSDIVKLRIVNSIGCVVFVTYGILVGAYPVIVSNFAIVIINIYYLYKMKKS